jgi:hypothetical protein
MFPVSLCDRTVGSKEIRIERAVESNKIICHLLSESVAKASGIQWTPYIFQTGPYEIVGYVELEWHRDINPKTQWVSLIEYWYITPSKLPDNVQAVVRINSFESSRKYSISS